LLGHGEVAGRQQAVVERVAKRNRPTLVKIMKPVGANARPVVNGHQDSLRRVVRRSASVHCTRCPSLLPGPRASLPDQRPTRQKGRSATPEGPTGFASCPASASPPFPPSGCPSPLHSPAAPVKMGGYA